MAHINVWGWVTLALTFAMGVNVGYLLGKVK